MWLCEDVIRWMSDIVKMLFVLRSSRNGGVCGVGIKIFIECGFRKMS